MEKMNGANVSFNDFLMEAISDEPSKCGLDGSCDNIEKNNDNDIVVNGVIKSENDLDNNIMDNYSNVLITSVQTTVASSQSNSNNLPYEVKGEDNSYITLYPDDIKKEVTCDRSETSDEVIINNGAEDDTKTKFNKYTYADHCGVKNEFSAIDIKEESFDYDDPQPTEEPSTSGGGVNNRQVEDEEESEDIKGVYLCVICDHKCAEQSLLVDHFNSNHSEQICDHHCKEECYQKKYLISNIMIQRKTFLCKFCKFRCTLKDFLLRHMVIHTRDKPFQCNVCGFKFVHQSKLTMHMMTHTGEKRFQCDQCDYGCIYKSKLKRHMITHTGEKRFQCNFCDYKCRDNSKLTLHVRTHTGERPFPCNFCDYKCSDKQMLTIHARKHTGEKPYRCNFCDERFKHRRTLAAHVKRHEDKAIVPNGALKS